LHSYDVKIKVPEAKNIGVVEQAIRAKLDTIGEKLKEKHGLVLEGNRSSIMGGNFSEMIANTVKYRVFSDEPLKNLEGLDATFKQATDVFGDINSEMYTVTCHEPKKGKPR
jgi:hypothetical protein